MSIFWGRQCAFVFIYVRKYRKYTIDRWIVVHTVCASAVIQPLRQWLDSYTKTRLKIWHTFKHFIHMQYFLLPTNLVIVFVHWVSTGVLYEPRQCSLFWDYIPESKLCRGVRGRMKAKQRWFKVTRELCHSRMNGFIIFGIMFMTAPGLENSPQSFGVYAVSHSRSVVTYADNSVPDNSPQSIGEHCNRHVANLQELYYARLVRKMAWYKILIHVLMADLQKTLPTTDLNKTKKLPFDKISPHEFYFSFVFNLYLGTQI